MYLKYRFKHMGLMVLFRFFSAFEAIWDEQRKI